MFETAINDLTNDHSDQDYNRILDDLSPVQLTHALTSFLQQIKKPNRLEMRKEWAKGLWISDTIQVVNHNHSNHKWRFNEKSALNEIGKKSVSIWNWWANWKKSLDDESPVLIPIRGSSKDNRLTLEDEHGSSI